MTSGAAKEVPSFQPTNRLEHRSNSPASLLARDISNISTPHLIRPLGRLWERFQAIWSNRLIVAALSGFGSKRTLLNDFELLVSRQPTDPLLPTLHSLRAVGPFEYDANRKSGALPKRAVKSFAPECHLRVGARNPVFVRDHRSRYGSPQGPNTIQLRCIGHLDRSSSWQSFRRVPRILTQDAQGFF